MPKVVLLNDTKFSVEGKNGDMLGNLLMAAEMSVAQKD